MNVMQPGVADSAYEGAEAPDECLSGNFGPGCAGLPNARAAEI
ncbi:MAG: hypothetical protein ACP5MD_01920 [Verrucomicrobiia bacterium]